MSLWTVVGLFALYAASVVYRAKLLTFARVSKFCQDVRHCTRKHRVVFIKPPHKPLRAVMKHEE